MIYLCSPKIGNVVHTWLCSTLDHHHGNLFHLQLATKIPVSLLSFESVVVLNKLSFACVSLCFFVFLCVSLCFLGADSDSAFNYGEWPRLPGVSGGQAASVFHSFVFS